MKEVCSWISEDLRELLSSEGITGLFDWQKECLSDAEILNPTHRNLVYSAPTSSGKTLVAELVALENVLATRRKALFVLPYVSVAKEKFFGLQKSWRLEDLVVRAYIGSLSTSFEEWNAAVCTIEKANSLVNRISEDQELHKLGVVVIDEIHMLLDQSRGPLIEALLIKILYYNKYSGREKIQIIVMSATFEFQEMIAKWLDARSYVSTYRPVVLEERILIGDELVDFPQSSESKVHPIPQEFHIKNDHGHVIGLCIQSLVQGDSVLVFCGTKAETEQVAVGIAKFIEYALAKNVFPKLTEVLNVKKLAALAESFKAKTYSTDTLVQRVIGLGVAFHHAGVTAEEREELEDGFRTGQLKILVSTSTLSSGVNLPAHRVLIRAQNNGPSQITRITYKQMVGRAGRKGHTGRVGDCGLLIVEIKMRG
uniref:DNA polymerase theta n=1 Tax=Steinernema glaseri TaxID=37863 RepID=A0A1I7Y1N3_9BILA